MEYTKEQIKYNWGKDTEHFSYSLYYPFSEESQSSLARILSAVPEESTDTQSLLTSYSESTNYNATIGQEYDDYQYSYEEGGTLKLLSL